MAKGRRIEIGKGCAVFVHNIYRMNGHSLKKTGSVFGITADVLKKSMNIFGLEVKNRPNFWKDGGAVCGTCKEFKVCDYFTITNRSGNISRASGNCIECNKKRRKDYLYEKIKQGFRYDTSNKVKEATNERGKQYYRDVMDGKYGEEKKNKMVVRMYNNSEKRRRIKQKTNIDNIDPESVFERDNWTCYICGVKTERNKKYKPNRSTIDHVIPLTKGGLHTYDNVRCCCNRCNIKKGNRQ